LAVAKYHVLAGFVTYAIFAVAHFVYFSLIDRPLGLLALLSDYGWVPPSLFLGLFGSTLPDYDLLYKYLSPWQHRSAVTHSALIPTLAFLVCLWPSIVSDYSLLLVSFMLGFASHLILDIFPNTDIEELLKKEKFQEAYVSILKSAEIGVTPEEFLRPEARKRLVGTYNIRFPKRAITKEKARKTLSPNQTRTWLIINGSIALIYAITLFILSAVKL